MEDEEIEEALEHPQPQTDKSQSIANRSQEYVLSLPEHKGVVQRGENIEQ